MIARVWGILGVVAFAAFVLGSLLGGVSLVLYAFGLLTGQLAVAGVAEILVSIVFLIAGGGVLFAAARDVRNHREPLLGRLLFVSCALVAGTCWMTIGVRGILAPALLRAAFGRS